MGCLLSFMIHGIIATPSGAHSVAPKHFSIVFGPSLLGHVDLTDWLMQDACGCLYMLQIGRFRSCQRLAANWRCCRLI